MLSGGAQIVQQYLATDRIDEINISLVPVFLGGGERLFDNLSGAGQHLEQVWVVEGPAAVHLR